MLQDLLKGNYPTEIQDLSGEIVTLAKSTGMDAPVNSALVNLIQQQEETKQPGSPCLSANDLLVKVGLADK